MHGRGMGIAYAAAAAATQHETQYGPSYYTDVLKFRNEDGKKRATQITIERQDSGYGIFAHVSSDTYLGRIFGMANKTRLAVAPNLSQAAEAAILLLEGEMVAKKGLIVHGKAPAAYGWKHISEVGKDMGITVADTPAPHA